MWVCFPSAFLAAVSISILGFHYSSRSVWISPFPLFSRCCCCYYCCAHPLLSWRIMALIQAVWSAGWSVTTLSWWNLSLTSLTRTQSFSYRGIRKIPSFPPFKPPWRAEVWTRGRHLWDNEMSFSDTERPILIRLHNTKDACAVCNRLCKLGGFMFARLWPK